MPDAITRPTCGQGRILVGLSATIATLCIAAAGAAALPYHVSQKGRAFMPGALQIQAGEAIEFINDDGDLLHHAYLESDGFSFDTGDQEPGNRSSVVFPVRGTFTVLCGIHPKMKLNVKVD